jgi:hypothetical protein
VPEKKKKANKKKQEQKVSTYPYPSRFFSFFRYARALMKGKKGDKRRCILPGRSPVKKNVSKYQKNNKNYGPKSHIRLTKNMKLLEI